MPFITQGKTNLKYILIVVILVAIVGGGIFFIAKSPAIAEAKELFTLYLDIDYVREESAYIFAELLEAKSHPERIGVAEEFGKLPPLSSRETLLSRLIENRKEATRALESVDEKSFSADDVSSRHKDIEIFYKQLADFEDFVIEGLSEIKTQEQFSKFIDDVFELRPDWEGLLAQDKTVLENLTQLAAAYELEFKATPYDELFGKRLAELGTPVISFGEAKPAVPPARTFKFSIDAQFGPGLLLTHNVPSPNIVLKYTRPDGIEINPQNAGNYEVYYGSSTTYQMYRGAGAEVPQAGEVMVMVENPDFVPFYLTFISRSSTRGYRWPSYDIKSTTDKNRKVWLDIILEEPHPKASYYTLMARVYDGQNLLTNINFSVTAEQQTCDEMTNTPVTLTGDGSGIYSALYYLPSNEECPAVGLSTNFVVAASGKTTSEQSFSVIGELKKFYLGVTALPAFPTPDILAPITSISVKGTKGVKGWYTSPVTITLITEDNENGKGVDWTAYSLDKGSTWRWFFNDTDESPFVSEFEISDDFVGEVWDISADWAEPPNIEDPPAKLTLTIDVTPPNVTVIEPSAGQTVEDELFLAATATDATSGVAAVYFYVREAEGADGTPIGYEELPATFNPVTDQYEYSLDVSGLTAGDYIILASAEDRAGNESWAEIVLFLKNIF